MPPRSPQNFVPNQPRTYTLSLNAILSFPFRLCNPPPAVGKVRSCSVTPLLNVRLEDVLERKHLPPLGLKDFEEWLLFVELSPENLYFILWLREYKQRYNQWKSQSGFQNAANGRNAPNGFPQFEHWSNLNPHSSHLAMFYARAKQTFLTPGSEYELNLTSSLLAPFHKANNSPHPDPAMFVEVELETYRTLEASLRRFVHAQLNNVGNKRVLCGLIAGLLFCLIGAIPPLVTSFMRSPSRWPRLAALPGLWLGLTVILASINGVCLGVYIFGDLRQLRKFELSRPPISKPQPLPSPFKPRSFVPNTRPLSATNSILPMQQPAAKPITPITDIPHPVRPLHYPSNHHHHDHDHRHVSSPTPSTSSARLSGETDRTVSTEDNIYISPAYYDEDEDDMDGREYYAGTEMMIREEKKKNDEVEIMRSSSHLSSSSSSRDLFMGTTTAGFIRPFEPLSDDDDDDDGFERSLRLPAKHQVMTPFNFDSLPSRRRPRNNTSLSQSSPSNGLPFPQSNDPQNNTSTSTSNATTRPPPPPALNTVLPVPIQPKLKIPRPPEPAASSSSSFIGRMQERCSFARWRLQTGYLEPTSPSSTRSSGVILPPHPSSPYWAAHSNHSSPFGLAASPTPVSLPVSNGASSSPSPFLPSSSPSPSPAPGPHTNTETPSSSTEKEKSKEKATDEEKAHRRRFKVINAVPAFAVPLTRVLSPVITRAQWEIVVRSIVVAFVLAWMIVGTLLAVPPVVHQQSGES